MFLRTFNMQRKPFADNVNNFHGSFSDFVPAILQSIGDQPALFFLDPIGIADLSMEDLGAGLPTVCKNGNLCVRFDAQNCSKAPQARARIFTRRSTLSWAKQTQPILAELFGGLRRNELKQDGSA